MEWIDRQKSTVHDGELILRLAAGVGAALFGHQFAVAQTRDRGDAMQTRPIPSSGEALPVIGCGTYVGFEVGADSEKLKTLAAVVRTLRDAGGKVFDSSPMYGRAEAVLGDLLAAAPDPERTFIATKVWTRGRRAGIAQMERSFALLRIKRIDLMQVHNLLDWQTHLRTLRSWKQDGRIRYLGVTHYTSSAYDELDDAQGDARSASCCRWRQSSALRSSSTCRSAAATFCGGCATGRCRTGRPRAEPWGTSWLMMLRVGSPAPAGRQHLA
jgi:hypothetical protein